jgi:hypothetical protein
MAFPVNIMEVRCGVLQFQNACPVARPARDDTGFV